MKKAILGIAVIGVIVLSSCGAKEYSCKCTFTDSTPSPGVALDTYTTETIITGKKKDATVVCETNSNLNGYYQTECAIN